MGVDVEPMHTMEELVPSTLSDASSEQPINACAASSSAIGSSEQADANLLAGEAVDAGRVMVKLNATYIPRSGGAVTLSYYPCSILAAMQLRRGIRT